MAVRELDGMVWRKSSYSSAQGECVEVGWPGESVAVRDSKNPAGPTLSFPVAQWRAFSRPSACGAG